MRNRHLYHPKWTLISRLIRLRRAGNRCEKCGVENGIDIVRGEGRFAGTYQKEGGDVHSAEDSRYICWQDNFYPGNLIRVILTVAHLDQDRSNNRFSNLAALCQRCHFNHDRKANGMRRKYGRDFYDRPNLFSSLPS